MGDYAGYARDLFKAIGYVYVAIVFIGLGLALWLPKRLWEKLVLAVAVLSLASIIPLQQKQVEQKQQVQVDEFKQRYDKAKAVFDEKCKGAGEKIYKTVDNLEGVLLLNIRQAAEHKHPNWPDAGHPYEYGGDSYVESFLSFEYETQYLDPKKKMPAGMRGQLYFYKADRGSLMMNGFEFVDVKQADGKVLRYQREGAGENSRLINKQVLAKPARYAVAIENSLDPEERKHWVAGTKVIVKDTKTGEILAERQAYAFEPGLGSTVGFRTPWLEAVMCPQPQSATQRTMTRFFVDQVIKPVQERK